MEYLTAKNCKRLTGYTFAQILSLSGIFGIHTKEELASDEIVKYHQEDIDGKTVRVEYETNLLKEFIVQIDLSAKTIKNEKFVSSGVKKGIGFDRLINQVDTAIQLGFKKISMDAFGDNDKYKEFDGYFVWGKYGFLMSDKRDKKDFQNKMKELVGKGIIQYEYRILYDLLCSENGVNIWREHGNRWLGEFNLSPRSKSMRIFNEVRKKKGL